MERHGTRESLWCGREEGDELSEASRRTAGYPRPAWFWAGVVAGTAGTLLHLPMFFAARKMDYRLAGMPPDPAMIAGMGLIVLGVGAVIFGLLPPGAEALDREVRSVRVHALDDAPLSRSHVLLLIALSLAVTIDVMKPLTLSFVVPGVAAEYGLASPLGRGNGIPVAWLPLAGIAGTMAGSFVWGALGDRIGRRNSILLAGFLFATTSVCGAMPSFLANVVMCFVMGVAAGGMIPIAFTLLVETVPRRHRGWLMILIGGNVTVAYVFTSWLAAALTPEFGWRILWLVGLPTGLLLILLNRLIPESPRYLLATGRTRQAREVLRRYGATVAATRPSTTHHASRQADAAPAVAPGGESPRVGYVRLCTRGFGGRTLALTILAAGVGLLTYSFQMWLPVNLGRMGFPAVSSDRILRDSALISLPLNLVTALLYGLWSARRTAVLVSGSAAAALVVLSLTGPEAMRHDVLMRLLLFLPLWGISATAAVVAAYSAEAYPTWLRSRGTSWAATVSKAGGVVVLGLSVGAATVPPLRVTALMAAVPLALATVAFVFLAPETRGRRLDEA